MVPFFLSWLYVSFPRVVLMCTSKCLSFWADFMSLSLMWYWCALHGAFFLNWFYVSFPHVVLMCTSWCLFLELVLCRFHSCGTDVHFKVPFTCWVLSDRAVRWAHLCKNKDQIMIWLLLSFSLFCFGFGWHYKNIDHRYFPVCLLFFLIFFFFYLFFSLLLIMWRNWGHLTWIRLQASATRAVLPSPTILYGLWHAVRCLQPVS